MFIYSLSPVLPLSLSFCVCMYVCMHRYAYVHVYINICACFVFVCGCRCTCVPLHVCGGLCTTSTISSCLSSWLKELIQTVFFLLCVAVLTMLACQWASRATSISASYFPLAAAAAAAQELLTSNTTLAVYSSWGLKSSHLILYALSKLSGEILWGIVFMYWSTLGLCCFLAVSGADVSK